MAHYPDRHSAALPALRAAQRVHGWCSPEAIEQVACVMRVTPAYLESVATFYDMLETSPVGRHSVYVCTNISCSLCGADELYEAIRAAAGGDPDVNVRAFECLGACDIAPMASVDGVYVGPLEPARRPAAARRRPRGRARAARQAARAPACGRPARQQPRVPRAPDRAATLMAAQAHPILLFADIDEPGLRTREVYERRGGYESLRKCARDERPRTCSPSSKPPGCADAAARASRWARRSRSCPRARSRSTSCATPTSPSRAPSRTAN